MPDMEMLLVKIKDSGIPITTICKRAGIERATLYNRLRSNGEWKVSEVVGMTNTLNLTDQEVNQIFLT